MTIFQKRSVQAAIATLLIELVVALNPEFEAVRAEMMTVVLALGGSLIGRFTYSNTDPA